MPRWKAVSGAAIAGSNTSRVMSIAAARPVSPTPDTCRCRRISRRRWQRRSTPSPDLAMNRADSPSRYRHDDNGELDKRFGETEEPTDWQTVTAR